MLHLGWNVYKPLVLVPVYAVKDTWMLWKLRNWRSIMLQKRHPLPLDDLQKRILADLRRDGISITHLDEFFPGSTWLNELTEYGNECRTHAFQNKVKTYWNEMWDVKSFVLDFKNPFLRFALEEKILAVANTYQGMYSRLHSIGLSETIPVQPGTPAMQSQLWHRDIGNKTYPKVFIYLTDVEEEEGPFIYVKGSQVWGRWNNLFPQINPHTRTSGRILDANIEKEPAKHDIIRCTGKAGTLIFADTAGIHKGGYSTRNPRFASIITFYSEKSLERRRHKKKHYTYPVDFDTHFKTLSLAAQFAVKKNRHARSVGIA